MIIPVAFFIRSLKFYIFKQNCYLFGNNSLFVFLCQRIINTVYELPEMPCCNKTLKHISTINEGEKNENISLFLKLRLYLRFNYRIQDPLSP